MYLVFPKILEACCHSEILIFVWMFWPFELGQTSFNVFFSGVSNGVIKRLPVGIFGSRSRVKLEENYTHGCSRWIGLKVPLDLGHL